MRRVFLILVVFVSGIALCAQKLLVVTTLPDLAAITEEIGGERVSAKSLLSGKEDAHTAVPKPSLMAQVNKADMFVEVGLELELWAERVLESAGNPRVLEGQPGFVRASDGVPTLEVPKVLTRAEGGVHPQGNPHIWLDPLNGIKIAENIAEGLQRIDPQHAHDYKKNLAAFKRKVWEALYGKELVKLLGGEVLARLDAADRLIPFLRKKSYKGRKLIDILGGWHKKMLPHRGKPLVSYHRTWSYFAHRFGLKVICELEPKPGIPPSPRHLAEVVKQAKAAGVKAIIVAPFYSTRAAEFVSKRIGAKVVVAPSSVGGDPKAKDYISLFDRIISLLLDVWSQK